MTLKNKTEEPKKDKAEPVVAPNDDLVSEISVSNEIKIIHVTAN